MNEHCMPGSTFDTRPLYTLPTTPRWRSRSTKISAARSSSRMATIVSWPLEEMIISLVIRELPATAWREGQDGRDGQDGDSSPSCLSCQRDRCQFVNLRMRTLSTRPKPASVAIIDDPP